MFMMISALAAAQPLTIQFSIVDENCANGNGWVSAMVSGGVPPYTYSWSTGATTPDITGLSAGNYDLQVDDTGGNSTSSTATVGTIPNIGMPSTGSTAGAGQITGFGVPCAGQCNGGLAYSFDGLTGTAPYYFFFSSPTIQPIGTAPSGAPIFGGFCPFTAYDFTVMDALGCSSQATDFIPWNVDTTLTVVDSVHAADCGQDNGSIFISDDGWINNYEVYRNGSLQTTVVGNTPGFQAITGLEAGTYQVLVDNWVSECDHWVTATVPSAGPGCGLLTGTVFMDSDQDCVQDVGEPGVPYRLMRVNPINELVITGADGRFFSGLLPGSYELEQLDPGIYPVCPPVQPVPFTLNGDTVTIDLADSIDVAIGYDLGIMAAAGTARPGFNHFTGANISNDGPIASDPFTVTCVLDANVSFVQAVPAPGSVIGNTLTWNFPSAPPYSTLNISIQSTVLIGTMLGSGITHVFTATATGAELNTANNGASAWAIVTGAFDPNDKTAFTSSGLSATEYFINQDEYIDYVIRFQNTGTDTAFTVVIVDTLAMELDQSTFQQGAASHPFTVAFKPDRVVEWTFNNILLPDSNTNEPLSHGLVSFRIRPTPPVMPGLTLANAADIFFDFNAPVRTNTSTLLASSGMGANEAKAQHAISVFPNPASDHLTVVTNGFNPKFVRILSADGRSVQHQQTTSERVEMGIVLLNAGAYIVEVVAADGTTHRQRVILR